MISGKSSSPHRPLAMGKFFCAAPKTFTVSGPPRNNWASNQMPIFSYSRSAQALLLQGALGVQDNIEIILCEFVSGMQPKHFLEKSRRLVEFHLAHAGDAGVVGRLKVLGVQAEGFPALLFGFR